MSLKYILKNGDTGQEVKRLQGKLPIIIDGKFGPKTEKAVKEYQQQSGLVADGLAGNQTLTSLKINVTPAVDLSSYNGTVDFKKMKSAGVSHAWIKLTEGTTHRNPGRQKKFDSARKEGVSCGAYHFGRPDTYSGDPRDWEKEANNFLLQLEKAGLNSGDLLPALDVEAGMKTDDNHNVQWCLNWLELVGNETNTKPLVYCAKWAYNLYLKRASQEDLQKLFQYPIWWASYIRKTPKVGPEKGLRGWTKWDIWQYTGHGEIEGCKGRVDLNWIAGETLEKLIIPHTHECS